jgi:hypothetical protein
MKTKLTLNGELGRRAPPLAVTMLPIMRIIRIVITSGLLACGANAAVTNVIWYRLGENDPGAASGQVVNSTAIDFMGVRNLSRAGCPRYTNDVSSDAAQIGSSFAVCRCREPGPRHPSAVPTGTAFIASSNLEP